MQDVKLLSSQLRSIGGLNSYELVISYSSYGIIFKIKEVIFIENGKMYDITFACPSTTYDVYLPLFEGSLSTFKIISPFPWQTILIVGIITGGSAIGVVLFMKKRTKTITKAVEKD
jgi:hypothetical protein